ncbi:MAG: hypothetical protein HND58_18825 [Planctomycetota bacterium]|nr:MAG: hypothetical protein HND58_18825 [Planctomycetota bacterium]
MKRYIGLGVVACFGAVAAAGPVFEQGFETDTAGWFDNSNGWNGQVNRVASGGGTLGLTSASGGFHAEFSEAGDGTSGFTRFDGYRSVFGAGFTAENKVYLDTGLAGGAGFDYTVAANDQSGSHLQDFIFHVSKDISTGKLLVAGDNNSYGSPRQDIETAYSNYLEVTASGWYTMQHVFRDAGGVLEVDMNLIDAGGTVLFTETRRDNGNLIATVVGGNRYGWFPFISNMTVGVDDTTLTLAIIPLPSAAGLALVGLGLVGTRRTRSVIA